MGKVEYISDFELILRVGFGVSMESSLDSLWQVGMVGDGLATKEPGHQQPSHGTEVLT